MRRENVITRRIVRRGGVKMTINIHYVRSDMSIILSDRRFTYGLKGEGGYSDDNIKLINLKSMGWATGEGLYNFVKPFNEKLSRASITHTDQVIDIFQNVMDQTLIKFPQYKERMLDSRVSFSLLGPNSQGTAPECKIVRLDKTLADEGRVGFIPTGCFHVIPPSDFTGDLLNLDVSKKYEGKKLGEEKLHEVIIYFLETFEEISRESIKVSKECDIGIYKLLGNEIHKLKLSGNVYDLLNKLKEGSVEDYIEVIEKRSIL